MSKLSKQRAKEEFLETIDIVDKSAILEEIRGDIGDDDLYTYFVKKDAFCTDELKENDINEFLLKCYSDWYFLHKNTGNDNPMAVKVLSEYEFAPVNLTGNSCFELVKNGQYNDVLPVFFQYINKLEEKYFICVDVAELYNRTFKGSSYDVRLYINLRADKLLDFAKDFLDKAYLEEFPALLKILNNDYRCDTITIYTDYEYVEKVIELIEAMKEESRSIFEGVGPVNTLLGSINDYIGFGEQLSNNATYFGSRCRALSSIKKCASEQLIRKGIVAEEKKLIFRKDGSSYTATEYLQMLIEKNAIKLVEKKIDEIESSGIESSEELDRLYAIRDNVSIGVDLKGEVDKLKKSITRKNVDYRLELEGIGEDNFDYVDKLFRLFTPQDMRIMKDYSLRDEKAIVAKQVFKTSENFAGVSTREFLEAYFRAELGVLIKDIIDEEIRSAKRTHQSGVLVNIKKKACQRLSIILKNILDDNDDGREYITDAINDYVRILSTGALENVEISVEGRVVSIDKDINEDIVSLIPSLQDEVNKLAIDSEFIDNILEEFGINKDNLCINKQTKNICKRKERKKKEQREFYYNPDGYLSMTR